MASNEILWLWIAQLITDYHSHHRYPYAYFEFTTFNVFGHPFILVLWKWEIETLFSLNYMANYNICFYHELPWLKMLPLNSSQSVVKKWIEHISFSLDSPCKLWLLRLFKAYFRKFRLLQTDKINVCMWLCVCMWMCNCLFAESNLFCLAVGVIHKSFLCIHSVFLKN